MGLYMDQQQLVVYSTVPTNGQHNLCDLGTGPDFPGSQLLDVAPVGEVRTSIIYLARLVYVVTVAVFLVHLEFFMGSVKINSASSSLPIY